MNLHATLTDPPKPLDPWLRHGFLVLCLSVLGWHRWWLLHHAGMRGRENIGLVLVALTLNHLAFRYAWPRPVMAGLRIVACAWIAFSFGFWLWHLQS
jgi:hypothetical protein